MEKEEREMWLVTFQDGGQFVVLDESEIVLSFGPNIDGTTYSVQKGIWTPTEEQ